MGSCENDGHLHQNQILLLSLNHILLFQATQQYNNYPRLSFTLNASYTAVTQHNVQNTGDKQKWRGDMQLSVYRHLPLCYQSSIECELSQRLINTVQIYSIQVCIVSDQEFRSLIAWRKKVLFTFTCIHFADTFIQSDFQERALQKSIGH